jgi:hypothetical protein
MSRLSLNVAVGIVKPRVQGLAVGIHRPARDFHHLAVIQIRALIR